MTDEPAEQAELAEVYRFSILADHGQFWLEDPQAHGEWMRVHAGDPGLAPAGWTTEASQFHRIGVEPHSISVGTAREDMVETTLRFHSAPPPAVAQSAGHVVEADVEWPSGGIVVYSLADDEDQARHVGVAPGRYRVRVSYVPSALPAGASETASGDHFTYQIDLWPAGTPTPLTVLKQGPYPW